MPFLNLPKWRMYYQEYGTGPNVIVAVHGNLASSLWWKFLLPHIPKQYRFIAMDLRGCGKSTHTSSGYEILQFVDDIKILTEKLELKQFHLLGHSMGGQISLAYAGVYAKQIQSLTLVDSVPADGLRLTEEGRQNFKELQKNNIVLRKAVESCFPYYRDAAGIDRFWRDAMHCSPEIYFSNPETMHDTILLQQAAEIKVPVLILHGRQDVIIPVTEMIHTIGVMQAARVVLLEKCGHSPFIEQPECAAGEFFGFLKAHGY